MGTQEEAAELTTDEIRVRHATYVINSGSVDARIAARNAEFNRWIEAHDAEVYQQGIDFAESAAVLRSDVTDNDEQAFREKLIAAFGGIHNNLNDLYLADIALNAIRPLLAGRVSRTDDYSDGYSDAITDAVDWARSQSGYSADQTADYIYEMGTEQAVAGRVSRTPTEANRREIETALMFELAREADQNFGMLAEPARWLRVKAEAGRSLPVSTATPESEQ